MKIVKGTPKNPEQPKDVNKLRKPPVRRVFGRLRNVAVDGDRYTFEMTKKGMVLWKKNSRCKKTVSLVALANFARDQMLLFQGSEQKGAGDGVR